MIGLKEELSAPVVSCWVSRVHVRSEEADGDVPMTSLGHFRCQGNVRKRPLHQLCPLAPVMSPCSLHGGN
ncbi:hypothetical protein ACOMHN_051259 [Nucella lapillus]